MCTKYNQLFSAGEPHHRQLIAGSDQPFCSKIEGLEGDKFLMLENQDEGLCSQRPSVEVCDKKQFLGIIHWTKDNCKLCSFWVQNHCSTSDLSVIIELTTGPLDNDEPAVYIGAITVKAGQSEVNIGMILSH